MQPTPSSWAKSRPSSFRRKRYRAGSRIVPHSHADASLTIVLSGDYQESIAGRTVEHSVGSLLVCPANMPHAQQFGASGASKLLVMPEPALLDYLAATIPFTTAPATRSIEIARIGRQIAVELAVGDGYSAMAAEGLLWQLAALLGRDLSRPMAPASSLAERACREIESAGDDPLSIAILSVRVNCHPATLTRAFRRELGYSPAEYQRRRRVDHAARLLRETRMPLSEIAAACGFCDQAHLSRLFRRMMGCSPGGFRSGA
ncbi:helix-turn-helix transcriptional regulator [Sphingomonas sp. So64.6b]|uniref:helix-turn-helix transcriptional regulator n=1 Tax=Sphingomonas sp. So64.6b TaxID=2997354 RepID=UPI001601DEBB|nr:AraC family transcriptional regulator [Sphingomonas sp. So64.6b]QNA83005.1 helix-turn-helix transcriptional regulator [Sphingomonas sp. So64.6b]